MNKLNWISGLRGSIAFLIVVYHLQQLRPISALADWDWALYQFISMFPMVVAVFFILTGLLRSLGYWAHILHGEQKPDTRKAIIDRWWRIAPAYYAVLVISFIWSLYLSGYSIEKLLSFFSGFVFLNWVSPMTFFPIAVNGPLWFIWYDMVGYIFTVFMMVVLTRIYKKYIYWLIIAYIFIFLGLHQVWVSFPWTPWEGIISIWFPHYSPFIFALYSIMGIIIGGLVTRYRNMPKSVFWDLIFATSIVSIFWFLWIIRWSPDLAYSYPMSPYRFPIIPGLWAIAIYALIYSRFSWRLMDNTFFTWLARISYSLYLWHGLVISILLTTILHHVSISLAEWSLFAIATIVISFGVAVLSVRYIENIRK